MVEKRSIYGLRRGHPHILPWIGSPHMSIPITLCPPFPVAYSRADKGKAKTATVHSLRAPNSFTTSFCLFRPPCAFLPAEASSAFPKYIYEQWKLSREHAEQQPTISDVGAIPRGLVSRRGIQRHIGGAFEKPKKEFGGQCLLLSNTYNCYSI